MSRVKGIDPALVVILAGVSAALHVGKLPPALPVLREALGVSLLQAGFLLSLVSLPAPSLVRQLVTPARLSAMLGLWGAYMPLGTALALLAGPWVMASLGWQGWWWLLAALSGAMALWLARAVPSDRARRTAMAPAAVQGWWPRLRQTLGAPGPWLVALSFAVYSGQWLAVIGFLPTVYAQAGLAGAVAGALTALAAAVNVSGNIASGRLLQRGVRPQRLLYAGFVAMAGGAWLAFGSGEGAPAALRYGGVLLFSALGGLVPGTLFSQAVRLAPNERTVSTTVGWVQQWSALGQFAGPPLVAWVAARAGGWQGTWVVTGACSLAGMLLAARMAWLRRG